MGDNDEMDTGIKEIGYKDADWTQVACDRIQCWAAVNTETNQTSCSVSD
jgi:hypothetical protein